LLFAGLAFDLIELAKEFQGLCGELAALVGIELIKFSPSVRCTSNFNDLLLEERLVADVVVAHELARPIAKERAGMLAAAALGEVVHDDRLCFVLGGAVAPQIGPVRATQAGL